MGERVKVVVSKMEIPTLQQKRDKINNQRILCK